MLGTYWLLRLLGMRGPAATGYALIMPWLLGFLIWNLFPFAASLYLSFTDYNLLQPPKWAGLEQLQPHVQLATRTSGPACA